jgi:hypothetical protein
MEPQALEKPNARSDSPSEVGHVGKSDAALLKRQAGAVDLDWQPSKLGATSLTYECGVVNLLCLKSEAASELYASEAESLDTACETAEVPARLYRSDTHLLEVVVPETYAPELDAVRAQRLQRESPREEALQAHAWLSNHPLGSRALPEELFIILDALPTSIWIDRVILSGEQNPYDVLYKRKYGDEFVSAADTGQDGTITCLPIADILRHEILRCEGL